MIESDLLFKPNDRVRHKVGSDAMIVIENEKKTQRIRYGIIGSTSSSPVSYTGYVFCSWYEGKLYKRGCFHQIELILIKENEMTFDIFLTDIISLLISATGEKIDNIKASVDKNKIAILRSDLVIQPGDLITRKMSNGGIENYEVVNPGYREKFATIPAGYDLEVKKIGIPQAEKREKQIINHYHFHGNNSRVNNNSIDQSSNIVKNNEIQVDDKISELRYEIEKLSLSKIDREEALDLIQALAEQMQSNPRPSVIKTIIAGLPDAANIASIGSFLLETIK